MGLGSYSGAGLSMGVAFTLVDEFSAVADRIQARMSQLSQSAAGLNSQINSASTSVTNSIIGPGNTISNNLNSAHGLLAQQYINLQVAEKVFSGAKSLFGEFVDAAKVDAAFQRYELGLQTFVGSAERAHELVQQITTQAIENPRFEAEGMIKANQRLVAMGEDAEMVKGMISDLTSILAGTGGGNAELNRASIAMEKVASAGQLSQRHMLSFSSAMIPMRALIEDAFGKPFDTLFKAGITLDMIAQALHKATGPTGRFAHALELAGAGVDGMTARFQENIRVTQAYIGEAFRPLTLELLGFANKLTDMVREFAKTDIGKWVIRFTLGLSALVLVAGGLIFTLVTLRIALVATSYAFAANTQAAILTKMAQRGLIAGFQQMAIAAWESIGPYVLIVGLIIALAAALYGAYKAINSTEPALRMLAYTFLFILGPAGWVIGIVMTLISAVNQFNDVLNNKAPIQGGFIGVLQRVGGLIRWVIELLGNYDAATKTFTVSKDLFDALDRMGLGQLASNIATWIGRFEAFWEGLKKGVKSAFDTIETVVLNFLNLFRGADDQLKSWDDLIGKNTSNMEQWGAVGEMVGNLMIYVLGAILILVGLIIAAMLLMAVVVAIVFAPFIVTLLFIYGIFTMIRDMIDFITDAGISWGQKFIAILNAIGVPLGVITSALETINGFMNDEKITMNIPAKSIWEQGYGTPVAPASSILPGSVLPASGQSFQDRMNQSTYNNLNKQPAGGQSNSTTYNSYPSISVPVYLDADKIGEAVLDKKTINDSMQNV